MLLSISINIRFVLYHCNTLTTNNHSSDDESHDIWKLITCSSSTKT